MKAGRNLQRSERFEATEGIVSHAGDVVVREVDPFEPPVGRERFRWDFRNVVLLQSPEITAMVFQLTHEFFSTEGKPLTARWCPRAAWPERWSGSSRGSPRYRRRTDTGGGTGCGHRIPLVRSR